MYTLTDGLVTVKQSQCGCVMCVTMMYWYNYIMATAHLIRSNCTKQFHANSDFQEGFSVNVMSALPTWLFLMLKTDFGSTHQAWYKSNKDWISVVVLSIPYSSKFSWISWFDFWSRKFSSRKFGMLMVGVATCWAAHRTLARAGG